MQATRLEKRFCQRSTGYHEPENRGAGDTGKTRSQCGAPPPPIGGPKREKHGFFSRILTPSAISRVWRRGVCCALCAIQVVFFGLPPMICLGGRGSVCHFYLIWILLFASWRLFARLPIKISR